MKTIVTEFGAECRDALAEPVDVAAREARRRLVEQQDARAAEKRARDLDLLPRRELEIADLGARVDLRKPDRGEMLGHDPLAVAAAELAERAPRRVRHQHVLGDGEVADEGQLLERGRNSVPPPGGRAVQHDAGAGERDLALVGRDEARKQLHHRRFAGAVLAEQGVCLARGDAERGILERNRRTEGFRHAPDLERRRKGHARDLRCGREDQTSVLPRGQDHCSGVPFRAALRPTSGVSGE